MIGIFSNAHCQSTLLWSEDYNVGLSNYFMESPTIQTEADTIKVIGRKNTPNGQRLLIVKYDLAGDTISTQIYGNDSLVNNKLIDYKFDSSNHVYLLQKELLGFYKSKIVLQKYSLDGNLLWIEQIFSPADTSFTPGSMGIANDTSVFITASKEYDYPYEEDDVYSTISLSYLYAYNSDGNPLWEREFNPITEASYFRGNILTHNNAAYLFSNASRLIKVDINNNLAINTTELVNGISNVQLTNDNNLLITAFFGRYRMSKINLDGEVIWTNDYGTNLPSNVTADEINSTIQDSVGNIYITGRHNGTNYGTPSYTNADILTLKYDSNGNLIWENRYEYGGNNADIGNTLLLKNGQIYVGGESQRLGQGTDYDYVVLKIDSSTGLSSGEYRYDGLANGDDAVSSLFVFDNGNVALTGLSFIDSHYDWTTQLLSDVVVSVQNISSEKNFQVYPNPTTSGEFLTIVGKGIESYSLVSTIGQIVQHGSLGTNDIYKIKLDNISTGMYLLQLRTAKEIVTRKIIVR